MKEDRSWKKTLMVLFTKSRLEKNKVQVMQKFVLPTHRGNKTRTTTQAVHLSNPKMVI